MFNINLNDLKACCGVVEFSDKLYEETRKALGCDGPFVFSARRPIENLLSAIVGPEEAVYWDDPRFSFKCRKGTEIYAERLAH